MPSLMMFVFFFFFGGIYVFSGNSYDHSATENSSDVGIKAPIS